MCIIEVIFFQGVTDINKSSKVIVSARSTLIGYNAICTTMAIDLFAPGE
jgi:hypothetical protein